MDGRLMAAFSLAVAEITTMPEPEHIDWHRLVSAAERAYCARFRRAGEHLVARALARRAVAAALGWSGDTPYQDITIRRTPSGRPEVALTGPLERWHVRRDARAPGVSLTHAGGYCAAVAWLVGSAGTAL
jgi:holo-[acyl-carrier protein] synthase